MRKLILLLVLGMTGLQFSQSAEAQVVPRVYEVCEGCIVNGTVDDMYLEGVLGMNQVSFGTIYFVVDGYGNTSVTFQATRVTSLDYPWQPNRDLGRGQYMVMKVIPNPYTQLASQMLSFYSSSPVGWQKDFVPSDTGTLKATTGFVAHTSQSTPIPIADLTFPDAGVNVWDATTGGAAQNAVLDWANSQMVGRVAVAQGFMNSMAQQLVGSPSINTPPTVTITVHFKDGSKMVLVANTDSSLGRFAVSKDYGNARDKNGNNVPISTGQVGGGGPGETAVYDFRNDQTDYDRWAARLYMWQISAPPRGVITCTGHLDNNGAWHVSCFAS